MRKMPSGLPDSRWHTGHADRRGEGRRRMTDDIAAETAGSLRDALARSDRMLLVRLRSLGDSILTLPLLQALRSWRPDLRLDVLVEAPYASVFLNHPAVNETLILRTRSSPAGWSKARAAVEIL